MMTPFDLYQKNIDYWTRTLSSALAPGGHMDTAFAPQQIEAAFQTSANLNLQIWTHMAQQLAAMPNWMHWPTQIPGRTMTDLFDMMRPFPEFVAHGTEDQPVKDTPQQTATHPQPKPATQLTAIKGIGPKMADRLASIGISELSDLVALDKADIERIETELSMMAGRIKRQEWIKQAKALFQPASRLALVS